MAGRLTRFLNLERPHAPGEKAPPPHEVATKARFTGEPSGIATEPDFGDQPFLRCPRCEADNTRYAQRCTNCSGDLTGEDVRQWNARLWAERKAQEKTAVRVSEEELLQQNRMLGEALAREVAQREQARLSWWASGTGADDATPIGVRLLSLLPGTQSRVIAGVAAALTFVAAVGVALSARGHPRLQIAGFVVGGVLALLFTPNVPRRRRWWW